MTAPPMFAALPVETGYPEPSVAVIEDQMHPFIAVGHHDFRFAGPNEMGDRNARHLSATRGREGEARQFGAGIVVHVDRAVGHGHHHIQSSIQLEIAQGWVRR